VLHISIYMAILSPKPRSTFTESCKINNGDWEWNYIFISIKQTKLPVYIKPWIMTVKRFTLFKNLHGFQYWNFCPKWMILVLSLFTWSLKLNVKNMSFKFQIPKCMFLDAFAKLQKAATSLIMSVCPSVCTEQLGSHRTDFHEIWYLKIVQKFVEKSQVSLQPDKNSVYFTWRLCMLDN
jgi:hypothetical protein